ncbi:Exodeoxyribonuclease V beta chain [Methylophaga frappieri]|uniref:RecBCD enzyme subunit RecB n=1 Tax=Methylophaga frappieri (strain ATCC BAA-2434 / DSM 25690 / JAM7) TaxID=754477 RepID=I1YH95_METFJ|nr:exodeoxyribonuclease V subunit beta [Methylophaga frappieri]AFJ02288.1 Exodeoxyribonuclease V beta chain [Methylophaga frappieri]
MTLLDAKTVNLSGSNLIEASAGTGKTFTLAELYCRFVIEEQLEVSQILVVTYTRAATEELRSRLRRRLVEARDALLAQDVSTKTERHRLQVAIQSFDEAAIYTIHGFCQRVLQDFAFESGHYFDMEMVTDEQAIKQTVVDDFWRRVISEVDPAFARYLLQQKQTPESLLAAVGHLSGKPFLKFLPLQMVDVEFAYRQAQTDFIALKKCWWAQRDEVVQTVSDTDLLNGNQYRKTSVSKWLEALTNMIQSEVLPESLFQDFDRFTPSRLEAALKKGKKLPDNDFWQQAEQFLTSHQHLVASWSLKLQYLRRQLADYLMTELPKRKRQNKVQAFDDLLINLQSALDGVHGGQLVTRIRQQFRAALIDEFQDTDPVQYDCFRRLFQKSELPVFFVGDPKQAIYSFRGADIFTYLEAKRASANEFNLDTNWRSHPLLVDAVNQLFQQVETPFRYADIPFIPVKAERKPTSVLCHADHSLSALAFWWHDTGGKVADKGSMQRWAADHTADDIAALLNDSASGKVQLTTDNRSRRLNGGDIAVLVRNHQQASDIQQALRKRGVNSVLQSRDNVFHSPQARMLEQVLMAIAHPSDDVLISTALATPLFADTALTLYHKQQNEADWQQVTDYFLSVHQRWQQTGFISMFRRLMVEQNVASRLLANPDGERQLTNLLHLAELTQICASRHNHAMEAVLTWLASQRQASGETQETTQIRLESDEQLVKVVTIHTSKGLEYPIVYCPFLWHVGKPRQKPAVISFHREEDNQACVAFGEPEMSQAELAYENEEKAESLRLLYVALTRARERCVINWAAVREVEKSALFSLLHAHHTTPEPAQMRDELQQFILRNPVAMTLTALSQSSKTTSLLASQDNDLIWQARRFTASIKPVWQVGSFTQLSRGFTSEKPDHDADFVVPASHVEVTHSFDQFSFPRGAQAGTCLHSIFEHWDFQNTGSDWQEIVTKNLRQHGIQKGWVPTVMTWLQSVVLTPLSPVSHLTLASIPTTKRLDEMAFYFPVNALTVGRLKAALMPHANAMPILKPVLAQLNFKMLQGFMKGFIDLVFESEGQFYIVDYKSNFLGNHPNQYQQAALEEAMITHHYPLQYLIYSLALHRYLKTRISRYDPDQHFGGVYYLFIRGMQPDWGQSGVFFDRPSSTLLDALDRCMIEVTDV